MIGFFLAWNGIMSFMMVTQVFAKWSRREFDPQTFILFVFPHWYIGILVPLFIGGIIPALITVVGPYSLAAFLTYQ